MKKKEVHQKIEEGKVEPINAPKTFNYKYAHSDVGIFLPKERQEILKRHREERQELNERGKRSNGTYKGRGGGDPRAVGGNE